MKRSVENDILEWKKSTRRKPLIIRGARQVGKTWLVENVLAKEFDSFVSIDLEKRRDLHALFEGSLDPKALVEGLEIIDGRIVPGKTLLFIDEVQACPRALMSLRYFYEQMPELHMVAAGSLLEFIFSEISFPVGRIQHLDMHPMTFFEYLLALNKKTMAEKSLKRPEKITVAVQQTIMDELRKYFFVGGMPESVKAYRDTGSMVESFDVQSEILDSYRADFSKYKPGIDTTCLDTVFQNVARSVGEQLKYTRLNEHFSYQTNHKAFDLLVKARLISKIQSCNPSGLPLGASVNPRRFKAALLDIGLMQQLCQIPAELAVKQENLLNIYQGRLAEQFVAQELCAGQNRELFYWSREARGSSAEVDFVVVNKGKIFPVEVKSGAAGRMKSIHSMLDRYDNCTRGLVLYDGTYQDVPEQKLTFLPLYCAAAITGDALKINE